MSIRFQADNDLNKRIVDATFRREPGIDFQTAQTAQLDYLDDQAVLRRAASEGRILVTHDKRTMPPQFARFLAEGTGVRACYCRSVRLQRKQAELGARQAKRGEACTKHLKKKSKAGSEAPLGFFRGTEKALGQ